MTCPHCVDAADFFGGWLARRDLRRYRRRGPDRTTRMLLEAFRAEGVRGRTVLDVGGGVGAVHQELLSAGAAQAIHVEASPAYHQAARSEAERRGRLDRVAFHVGDFVDLGDAVPPADIVALDRVLCCYPDVPGLLGASATHATRLLGAVFPREHLAVRLGVLFFNIFHRLRGSAFRVYVHPAAAVEAVARAHGFSPRVERTTFLWRVRVWARDDAASSG